MMYKRVEKEIFSYFFMSIVFFFSIFNTFVKETICVEGRYDVEDMEPEYCLTWNYKFAVYGKIIIVSACFTCTYVVIGRLP